MTTVTTALRQLNDEQLAELLQLTALEFFSREIVDQAGAAAR